jgi:hypothetical protein
MKSYCLPLSECISQEPVLIKHSGFFLAEGLLFIPVPEWEGWKCIDFEKGKTIAHFVRWEFYFHPRNGDGWIFLRITWPSVSQIVLGFVYPDDRKILEMIALHRRLALTDQALIEGRLYPFSNGIVVNDIPVDLLKVFGIDFDRGQNLIQKRKICGSQECLIRKQEIHSRLKAEIERTRFGFILIPF